MDRLLPLMEKKEGPENPIQETEKALLLEMMEMKASDRVDQDSVTSMNPGTVYLVEE